MTKIRNVIFYSILLFLPTQLGKHFWPSFSYVSGIRVDYLSPTIYLTDILIFSLFVIWLIPIFKNRKEIIHIKNLPRRQAGKILRIKWILLIVFLLIGIIFSQSSLTGFYGLLKLGEFIFLGFYIAEATLRLQTIISIFAIGVVFESLLAIAQFIQKSSIGGLLYFFGERMFTGDTPAIANAVLNGELVLRPYATFPHPNVLAGYLVIAMAITILNIKNKIVNIQKIIYIFSIILGTIALFLTMSRIAILLWVFIPPLLVKKNKFTIYYLLFTIFMVSSIIFLSPISSRFTNFSLTDESVVVRQQLLSSSWEMMRTHPLLGVGLHNFLINLPSVQKPQGSVYSFQPVHNIYLLVLAETGIVGFAFFAWLILKSYQGIRNPHFAKASRGRQESGINKKKSIIHNSKFIILSLVLVLGLFDHYFLTLQQGQMLFTLIVGLCLSSPKKVIQ